MKFGHAIDQFIADRTMEGRIASPRTEHDYFRALHWLADDCDLR